MIHFDINEVGNLSLFFAPFYSLPEYGNFRNDFFQNLGTCKRKYERHRIREMVYEYFETKQFKIYKSECDLECLDIHNSYANCSLLGFRGTNFALYSAGRTVNDGTFSEDGGSRGLAGKTCTSKLNSVITYFVQYKYMR